MGNGKWELGPAHFTHVCHSLGRMDLGEFWGSMVEGIHKVREGIMNCQWTLCLFRLHTVWYTALYKRAVCVNFVRMRLIWFSELPSHSLYAVERLNYSGGQNWTNLWHCVPLWRKKHKAGQSISFSSWRKKEFTKRRKGFQARTLGIQTEHSIQQVFSLDSRRNGRKKTPGWTCAQNRQENPWIFKQNLTLLFWCKLQRKIILATCLRASWCQTLKHQQKLVLLFKMSQNKKQKFSNLEKAQQTPFIILWFILFQLKLSTSPTNI